MQIDWAVLLATLLGPILAVWASEWRQRRRALYDRKEWVFRTLCQPEPQTYILTM